MAKSMATAMAVLMVLALAMATLHADGPRQGKGPDLEHLMESMEKAQRAITRDVKEKNATESTLKAIADMQRDALAAKGAVPEAIAKLTGEAKTKALASYRGMMNNIVRQLLDLEDVVGEKKYAEAEEILTAIKEIEKQGHKEFRQEH